MKFSENWLRQHVKTSATREELTATLTAIGLEVEAMSVLGEVLDGVVVARIVECAKHPEADRLQVCLVDAGALGKLQIVCGAPNARPGLCAPLATIGARVGELTIKPAKLRGVESDGMLCSAKELGLDADASGLLELPADAPVGAPLAGYLGLPDATIELKLTPNRADCFSLRGIAHDVAAALGCTVEAMQVTSVPAAPVQDMQRRSVEVTLEAGADAPRFAGRVIEGVDATVPTPVWMAERLRRSGVRPVSLLVDITQYVMLELGQPMHAYDLDTLHGPVNVRYSRPNEALVLLNGEVAGLGTGEDFLVISDFGGESGKERAIGLAGIMGGASTKVSEATRNVFLEAAHFAPGAIIGRSRRLGLHTDAAHRFERGVDPGLPPVAIEHATRLIVEFAGGKPGPLQVTDRADDLPLPRPVSLRRSRLARVLGMTVDDAEVVRILAALGMDVEATDAGWHVIVPTRRFDITLEEDLIEEVARIHGYDRVPSRLPQGSAVPPRADETRVPLASLSAALRARDLCEAICFSFVDADLLAGWGLEDGGLQSSTVALANPLSRELAVMRPSLLPGLVQALTRNLVRQQTRVRLFETGRVFHAPAVVGDAPRETERVAWVVTGSRAADAWANGREPVDFADIKGDLESLARLSGASLAFRPARVAWLHPGRSAEVWREDTSGTPERLGWLGELHPRLATRLGLDRMVLACELDLEALLRRELPRARPLSRFPGVRRDLAVIVAEAVTWADLEHCIREAAGPLLRTVWPFDQYQGPSIGAGCKSIAVGLILQDDSRTLTDHDVDAVTGAVTAALAERFQARLRDQ